MIEYVIKRDGRRVPYSMEKIRHAISSALNACNRKDDGEALRLAKLAEKKLFSNFKDTCPTIEQVQDTVETVLMENKYANVAKKYILYRAERTKAREMNSRLMRIYDEITSTDSINSDMKRDNANIDGDTAMGAMLKYGSEGAKDFYEKQILPFEQSKAHRDGDIHIHDFDFYTLTTTCCQIDIEKLFKGGFSTGHGHLREPNSIASYSALACIAIQSNQNDQHGGQSIPNFDYGLANGVKKSFKKIYMSNIHKSASLLIDDFNVSYEAIKDVYNKNNLYPQISMSKEYCEKERLAFKNIIKDDSIWKKIQSFTYDTSVKEVDTQTLQAMEALVHNLNTMHSRAGAQTPFSSINYGTDISPEGRLITKNILLATEAGLGNGETAIFPIHIFKVKEGVNYNKTDPNYDLFQLACRVSSKRLYPNFSFLDAPFNISNYKPGKPETEVAYMGCRTRVLANVYDRNNQTTFGRGNLSFTSINLPRIALKSNKDLEWFFEELEKKMQLVTNQLLDRFKIQCKKKVKNYPFLMGQGIWMNSDKLSINDTVEEVLKNGTLSVGFIGLAETLIVLTGKHHGQSLDAKNLGLEIVSFMREYLDNLSEKMHLNFTLLATPAEGLAGRFVKLDAKRFGIIPGVTDREYYTNSFHIPVYFPISSSKKLELEAPYHALTNAGHISYVELDGDTAKNVEAFESIVRYMKELGIGYGSINHPVDRDPECGYNGIINDECPKCHRKEKDGQQGFERIRRITGYLVGTLDRFNDAKRAEEKDRVKHNV